MIWRISNIPPYIPFAEEICCFLEDVSKYIFSNREAKKFPDIIGFAFFCRKANLQKQKKQHEHTIKNRLGRGVTFHIAPSNVPINFAYSLIFGLLTGNLCVVRVSSKPFEQTTIICNILNDLLTTDRYRTLSKYIHIVSYNHNKDINDYFTSLCDVRIIWGGDESISQIRRSPLQSSSLEVTFSDRYSISILNAESVLNTNLQTLVKHFYNDTYLYDQNACTSPHLIVWIGENGIVDQAQQVFWDHLHELVLGSYDVQPIMAVDKLIASYKVGIEFPGSKLETMPDNLIRRVRVPYLDVKVPQLRCIGGSFIEYTDKDINALKSIITKKYQTLSYFGLDPEELRSFIIENRLSGIDRIVPIGKTTDIGLIWDGYDLVGSLTRIIDII